mmetsp:Transcript_427/g.1275  ORF Transcript_427/g.1275 Transcript_427/m.1275 type:complete len:170 (-) Transcript_427:371-880(-)
MTTVLPTARLLLCQHICLLHQLRAPAMCCSPNVFRSCGLFSCVLCTQTSLVYFAGAIMWRADGYDHNYVLNDEPSSTDKKLRQAAVLQDPASGRSLEVATDAPGLQFYSGNFLDGSVKGKGGAAYGKHAGVALETQAFPNSINQPSFPNVILRPGETYRHEVSYVFRAK